MTDAEPAHAPDDGSDSDWPGPVLRTTLDALRARSALAGVRLDRVTVGASAVLVELVGDDAGGGRVRRSAGLAHRPSET